MLNRMAESFYWIGRYTERIDYTARIINVNYYAHHQLSDNETNWNDLQRRFTAVLTEIPMEKKQQFQTNNSKILEYMTYDRTYVNSIINCVRNARDNVRVVRQYASNRMWDTLNQFYLWLNEQNRVNGMEEMPFLFFEKVRREVALFQAITDASMLHEVEWRFLKAGKLIERAGNVIRVLSMFYDSLSDENGLEITPDYQRFISLLEAVDGYEAFRKVHGSEVTSEKITEFLILNSVFPGSVYFSLFELEENLRKMRQEFDLDNISGLYKQVNRLRTLIYQCLDLRGRSLKQHRVFLQYVLNELNQIGTEINKCFIPEQGDQIVVEKLPRKLAKTL